MPNRGAPMLVPELDVGSIDASLVFYVELLGFHVIYARPAEGFAYLARDGAELMLEAATGPGRRFRTATLEQPFGRGVNFQLEVADVDALYARVLAAGRQPLIAIEERWYEVDGYEAGNRQFVVADPDGYLWRPFTDIGTRSSSSSE